MLALSVSQMRSLQHTRQCAVSHIFNICGENVNFICSITDKCPMYDAIVDRRRHFLRNLGKLHYQHSVLYQLYLYFGLSEIHLIDNVDNSQSVSLVTLYFIKLVFFCFCFLLLSFGAAVNWRDKDLYIAMKREVKEKYI